MRVPWCFLFLCLIKCSSAGGYHADGCNVGWDLANGECYFFSRFAVNFFTAQNFCKLYGGKLAEIDEYNEFAALRSISRRKGNEKYWIGLTDVFVEGVWLRPSTQEVQGFYQWESGEPNNLGGNENCVEVYPNTLLWNDLPCDRNRTFICEKE